MKPPTSVTVIGLGYIGLPTAAILAANGIRVYGADVNPAVVAAVNQGRVPFVEPDLGGYVEQAVRDGLLTASDTPRNANAYVVAVPTPVGGDHLADLSYVEAGAKAVAAVATPGQLVILESTSPPGTTEKMAHWIAAERPDLVADDGTLDLLLAHCPERVLPGRIMTELVTNDRIVGGLTPTAAQAGSALYKVFCQGQVMLTDAVTAEMSKLVENAFRDVNIAFANELSVICDRLGIDVWRLIELANHHPRVNVLRPGTGVGGHCIAVDPYFIVEAAPDLAELIAAARRVNSAKPDWVVDKVCRAAGAKSAPRVALLGLAFKPNIDDLRESPSVEVAAKLAQLYPQGEIMAVEPHISALPPQLAKLDNVSLTELAAAVERADVVAVLVAHQAFAVAPTLAESVGLVDAVGLWCS